MFVCLSIYVSLSFHPTILWSVVFYMDVDMYDIHIPRIRPNNLLGETTTTTTTDHCLYVFGSSQAAKPRPRTWTESCHPPMMWWTLTILAGAIASPCEKVGIAYGDVAGIPNAGYTNDADGCQMTCGNDFKCKSYTWNIGKINVSVIC